MIISASRRTDIPAHYAVWLMHRIRAGKVVVHNPYRPSQRRTVSLLPQDVDCIVFWTKDSMPLMPYLHEITQRGFNYYFQFTLNAYGPVMERRLRPFSDRLETMRQLSGQLGPDRVCWRYDPIVITKDFNLSWHIRQFESLCQALEGQVKSVTFSFMDSYRRTSAAGLMAPTTDDMIKLGSVMGLCANAHGFKAMTCCEAVDLSQWGVDHGSCIDGERIARITGKPLPVVKDRNQRLYCGCMPSVDIGAYHTCLNDCVYCYATSSHFRAEKRRALMHDEDESMGPM